MESQGKAGKAATMSNKTTARSTHSYLAARGVSLQHEKLVSDVATLGKVLLAATDDEGRGRNQVNVNRRGYDLVVGVGQGDRTSLIG